MGNFIPTPIMGWIKKLKKEKEKKPLGWAAGKGVGVGDGGRGWKGKEKGTPMRTLKFAICGQLDKFVNGKRQ